MGNERKLVRSIHLRMEAEICDQGFPYWGFPCFPLKWKIGWLFRGEVHKCIWYTDLCQHLLVNRPIKGQKESPSCISGYLYFPIFFNNHFGEGNYHPPWGTLIRVRKMYKNREVLERCMHKITVWDNVRKNWEKATFSWELHQPSWGWSSWW